MSVVMGGMSEAKGGSSVLQVVRVARYVLLHPGEAWLFGYQSAEDTVCVQGHGLVSRRADQEICIVHCGEVWQSHDLTCVAKQSLDALSSGEAEFYGIVRAVATSKQTSQILEQIGMQSEVTIASDSSAARGICTRTGSGKVRHLFNRRVVDTRIVSQERVPVGVGRHVAELDGHWN